MLYATVRQRKIAVKLPNTIVQNGVNVDHLQLDMDSEWRSMEQIICLFQNGDIQKEVPYVYGNTVTIPAECLTHPGELYVSITGYVHGKKVMTTAYPDSYWEVVPNGAISGEQSLSPAEWPGWKNRQTGGA